MWHWLHCAIWRLLGSRDPLYWPCIPLWRDTIKWRAWRGAGYLEPYPEHAVKFGMEG